MGEAVGVGAGLDDVAASANIRKIKSFLAKAATQEKTGPKPKTQRSRDRNGYSNYNRRNRKPKPDPLMKGQAAEDPPPRT